VTVTADGLRLPVARARLQQLAVATLGALGVRRALVSVTCLSSRAMATMNRRHLGHRGPTDVITFALGRDAIGVLHGDIYICPEVARAQAKMHGVSVREELARLVIHGALHCCGWEHPEDDSRVRSPMWRRQEQLLRRFWVTSDPTA
jgi:probable rRNA maturation factor